MSGKTEEESHGPRIVRENKNPEMATAVYRRETTGARDASQEWLLQSAFNHHASAKAERAHLNLMALAACRTIRAEAKDWPFENRFWLI